jgi:general L-amino acid transport system permease protein
MTIGDNLTPMDTSGAYLGSGDLPQRKPPAMSRGAVAWVRDNLFSSIPNTIMTLLGFWILWELTPPVLNFLIFDAVWEGSGRDACLESVRNAPVGACWAFVKVRLGYFFYGQYPIDERWRVDTVWAMGAIGVVWLLWPRVPYKNWGSLYFFLIFPVVAFFLLVGTPTFNLQKVPTNLWGGVLVTLVLSTVGIVFSLPLGVLLALGRRSKLPLVRLFSVIFIEFVRGVPLITVLFMANVMLPLFLPDGWRPDSLIRVLVGIALFASAYMAEIVRGGLQAIGRGQYEGAQSLGLGYWQMMVLIILPQALKIVIPNIVNTFIGLFKDTTLVSIVGIFDFLKTIEASFVDPRWATPVTRATGYAFAAIFYFIFCWGMSQYSQWMERKLATGHKR